MYLLLDCSGSMAFGTPRKLDYGKKLAAALAYVGAQPPRSRVDHRTARRVANQRLAPTRGKSRIFTVFEFLRPLEAVGPDPAGRCDRHVRRAAQAPRRGGADQRPVRSGRASRKASTACATRASKRTCIHVTDAADAAPRLRGDVELVDAETGESRPVTITPALARRYEQAYAAYTQRITSFCAQKKVGLFSLDTRTPPEEAMLRILRRGGLVA